MSAIPTHVIQRRAVLHFVSGVIDAALVPLRDGGLSDRERKRCATLYSQIAHSRDKALAMEPEPETPKEKRRVDNSIHRLNGALWKSWKEEVDAREVVVAAISLVAVEQERLDHLVNIRIIYGENAQTKRLEWNWLHTLLAELYETLDPDYEAAPMDRGCAVGDTIRAALSGGVGAI